MSYGFFNFAAAQLLGNGAMHYAATVIVPPAGPSPANEIERARQIVAALDAAQLVRAAMADALKELQLAAVAFTAQAAASNYRSVPNEWEQLEDKLAELIQRRGGIRMSVSHTVVTAAEKLGASALDYAKEIVAAEDGGAPIGSAAVQLAIADLQIAAITFVVELAIAEGCGSKRLRRIEKKLAVIFGHETS